MCDDGASEAQIQAFADKYLKSQQEMPRKEELPVDWETLPPERVTDSVR